MSNVANFKRDINNVKNRLENFKITDDLDEDQRNLEEIEEEMRRIEGELEVAEDEIKDDEESNRPLLDKFKEQQSELNVLKNNFQKIQQNFTDAHRDELLKRDKLTGAERKKAQNDMAKDLVKETDRQGLMLEDVHKKVIGANQDLTDMSVEAQKQGEKIGNLGEHVIEIDQSVKKTGNTMSEIEGRICCRKFVLCLGIFILFLLNIIFVFLIIAKKFQWKPFGKDPEPAKTDSQKSDDKSDDKSDEKSDDPKSDTPSDTSAPQLSIINGINLEADQEVNFSSFSGKSLPFVLLKAGESTTSKSDSFKQNMESAKMKSINLGAYWLITKENENEAIDEAKAVNDFLTQLKKENKLSDLDYDFYLTFDQNNQLLKEYALIDKLCAELKEISCGIALSSSNYENYFKNNLDKIQNIKSFWLEPSEDYDIENVNNLAFWKTRESIKVGDTEYSVIKAKE